MRRAPNGKENQGFGGIEPMNDSENLGNFEGTA
jgi:hypothetical protein